MALFDGLDKPVSADSPCGPDPELNQDIQNFLLECEAQLPASYRDFNKKTFDARPSLKKLEDHLVQSRDLRFLVLTAKYLILSDNLQGYGDAIEAMAKLLAAQWDHCHPTELAGGTPLRSAYLQSLDDLPTSVLPLQNATLLSDKRTGTISWRTILVADKKLPAKPDETVPDAQSLRDAFARIEPVEQLQVIHGQIARVGAALKTLRQIIIDKAGYEHAPQFEKLPELTGQIEEFLGTILKGRVPEAAAPDAENAETQPGESEADTATGETTTPGTAPATVPDIASVTEASNALQAILAYYAAKEPSSPARLMITQASQLVGKSFIEAMKILAPALAEKAKINIGGDAPFTLNFAQLSALAGGAAAAAPTATEARSYTAATRAEATTLMRKVEQFYRLTEPSSPIPLLIEQARSFVAKDFAALLREMAKPEQK
jgi:type VI secretion system protein ImpA